MEKNSVIRNGNIFSLLFHPYIILRRQEFEEQVVKLLTKRGLCPLGYADSFRVFSGSLSEAKLMACGLLPSVKTRCITFAIPHDKVEVSLVTITIFFQKV